MQEFIIVKFSCDVCGLVDAEAPVRARRRDEDVCKWLGRVVANAVQERHQLLSFTCPATRIANLKIPLPSADDPEPWIGKAGSVLHD